MEGMNTLFENFIDVILQVLPVSPFAEGVSLSGISADAIGYLNWFFPVHSILSIMAAWLAAIALYYAYSIVARWIKLIA